MEAARRLAGAHGLERLDTAPPDSPFLAFDGDGLALCLPGDAPRQGVRVDFLHGPLGYRAKRLSIRGEPLARAAGLGQGRRPDVLDATAGLGRDAFVLAALGCRVRLVERVPAIRALLDDGLRRLAQARPEIAERMILLGGDAREVLSGLSEEDRPDVVVLDPMYPDAEREAAARREMRVFRAVVGDDPDADDLLDAALTVARSRVVVKRPLRTPPLAGRRPHHASEGASTRFDVYLVRHQ